MTIRDVLEWSLYRKRCTWSIHLSLTFHSAVLTNFKQFPISPSVALWAISFIYLLLIICTCLCYPVWQLLFLCFGTHYHCSLVSQEYSYHKITRNTSVLTCKLYKLCHDLFWHIFLVIPWSILSQEKRTEKKRDIFEAPQVWITMSQ